MHQSAELISDACWLINAICMWFLLLSLQGNQMVYVEIQAYLFTAFVLEMNLPWAVLYVSAANLVTSWRGHQRERVFPTVHGWEHNRSVMVSHFYCICQGFSLCSYLNFQFFAMAMSFDREVIFWKHPQEKHIWRPTIYRSIKYSALGFTVGGTRASTMINDFGVNQHFNVALKMLVN